MRPFHRPDGVARFSPRSIETRRRAGLKLASALAAACFAFAAHAGSIPLAPAEPAQPSAELVEAPAGAEALPADVSSLVAPVPADLQPFIDDPSRAQAPQASSAPAPSSAGAFGFLGASWQGQNLLGDMGGLRPALSNYGISLSVIENAEVFGNLTGGVRQGFEANGLTTATVQVDTQKAFGLAGGLFNVSGLQIWGGDLSEHDLYNLQTVTGIEAPAGIRLWELWYQQKFSDKFDIKIGEQSLDQEWMVSQNSAYFLNAMFGWAMVPTADFLGGGPAYPLAGLGARARAQVTDSVTVLAGLFNGSPIPANSPNTPLSNPYGVSFPLNTGLLAIAELQFTLPGSDASKANGEGPLPGTYKIGAWYDSGVFYDQQFDNQGAPLASPASDGIAATRHGNYSIYAVADQEIWQSKDDPKRNLNIFVRPMFAPLADRNLISFAVDAGLTLHEPLPGRENDVFGLGFGVAQVSGGASAYDRDLQFYEPAVYTPVRGAETFIEATYQVQVLPWWQIQPDIQYVVNPGGGIANPNDPTQRIKNELVIGLRTNITF